MPLNKTFITNTKFADGAQFNRVVNITVSVVNSNVIRFNIDTNLNNTTMKLRLDGVVDADFDGETVLQSFTTSATGVASLTYNLNQGSILEKEFNGVVVSDNGLDMQTSSNVFINVGPSLTATGGTESTFNAGTIDEYKVHTFTTNGSLNVTSTTPNGTVYQQVVGGGGAGGGSFRYQQMFGGAFNNWSQLCGGGGGGGQVLLSNVNPSAFSVSSYPVTIGTGGQGVGTGGPPTSATSSTFNNLTASPGGYAGSYNAAYTAETGMRNGGGGGAVWQDWLDYAILWDSNGYQPGDPYPTWTAAKNYYVINDLFSGSGSSDQQWGNPVAYNGNTGGNTGNWDYMNTAVPEAFNQAGKRPTCVGGVGSLHSGGFGMIYIGGSLKNLSPTFVTTTLRNEGDGGSGATDKADGIGNEYSNGYSAKNTRQGPYTWIDYPEGTHGHTIGEGGGGGKKDRTPIESDVLEGYDATNPGSAGGGGNAFKLSSDGTTTTYPRGGNGANGQVQVAYKVNIRSFSTTA